MSFVSQNDVNNLILFELTKQLQENKLHYIDCKFITSDYIEDNLSVHLLGWLSGNTWAE